MPTGRMFLHAISPPGSVFAPNTGVCSLVALFSVFPAWMGGDASAMVTIDRLVHGASTMHAPRGLPLP